MLAVPRTSRQGNCTQRPAVAAATVRPRSPSLRNRARLPVTFLIAPRRRLFYSLDIATRCIAVCTPGGRMKTYRFRLSVMMFLEFFIWGAWLPLIFGYLPSMGFDGWQQG